MIGNHVADDAGAKLLALLLHQASLEVFAEGGEVFVVGVVGCNLGDGQDVVVDVDLVAEEFGIAAFKGLGEDGVFVHQEDHG